VQAVIGDDAFHTQSPVAANVLSAAEKLEKWLVRPENRPSAEEFSSLLLSSLKACVPCNVTSTKSRGCNFNSPSLHHSQPLVACSMFPYHGSEGPGTILF